MTLTSVLDAIMWLTAIAGLAVAMILARPITANFFSLRRGSTGIGYQHGRIADSMAVQRRNSKNLNEFSAIAGIRSMLASLLISEAILNLLYIAGALLVLAIFDRVIPQQDLSAFGYLGAAIVGLFLVQSAVSITRSRTTAFMTRATLDFLEQLSFDANVKAYRRSYVDMLSARDDLQRIRTFLSDGNALAFFDLPWIPMYAAICFLIQPWLGIAVLSGGAILIAISFATEILTNQPTRKVRELSAKSELLRQTAWRNAEAIRSMGMLPHVKVMWSEANQQHSSAEQQRRTVTVGLAGLTRSLRYALEIGLLAIGAYLVIGDSLTIGGMVASALVAVRAFDSAELAISQWNAFSDARASWRRVSALRPKGPDVDRLPLPGPSQTMSCEHLTVAIPGTQQLVVHDINFHLAAGQGLGIVGPSAAGKSSLARALVGVWPAIKGAVRLDGASIDQWNPSKLGPHVGYLPQDVELLAGTVAQNISRFDADATPDTVIKAAKEAGIHELILRMPNGYETYVNESGTNLSFGERQRIGIARALYGEPFFVVLDEPNSNMDREGEEALARLIHGIRNRGGVAIVVTHRPNVLTAMDQMLILLNGRQQAFGTRDALLSSMISPTSSAQSQSRGAQPKGTAA